MSELLATSFAKIDGDKALQDQAQSVFRPQAETSGVTASLDSDSGFQDPQSVHAVPADDNNNES